MSRPPSRIAAGHVLVVPPSLRRWLAPAALALAVTLAPASSAAAQQAAPAPTAVDAPVRVAAPVAPAAESSATGPLLDGTRAGVQTTLAASEAATGSAMLQERRRRFSRGTILMIVGATAILIGAMTDSDADTPLILGGAVIGLTGLYLNLR